MFGWWPPSRFSRFRQHRRHRRRSHDTTKTLSWHYVDIKRDADEASSVICISDSEDGGEREVRQQRLAKRSDLQHLAMQPRLWFIHGNQAPVLNQQECQRVRALFNLSQKDEQVAVIDDLAVRLCDVWRLKRGRFLNDEIINAFGRLLEMHCAPQGRVKWLVSSSFRNVGVRRRIRDDGGGDDVRIMVPINLDNLHWLLAVVSLRERTITVLDSMRGSTGSAAIFRQVRLWLDEVVDGLPKKAVFSLRVERVAQQPNGHDCGVFVCLFMYYLMMMKRDLRDVPLKNERDSQRWRWWLASMLVAPSSSPAGE